MHGTLIITVQPDHISRELLSRVDTVIATGEKPDETLRVFAEKLGRPAPPPTGGPLGVGEGVAWSPRRDEAPFRFRGVAPHAKRQRHFRKYAEGDLGPDRSFYFRGADGRLNLGANNLFLFNHLAVGVDDDTWTFHLRRNDFSRWVQASTHLEKSFRRRWKVQVGAGLHQGPGAGDGDLPRGKRRPLPAGEPGAGPEGHRGPLYRPGLTAPEPRVRLPA
jgi:hypothetical protein